VRISELRNSAFVMVYRIERGETVTAQGTTNLVAYDYQVRKPRRLPEPFRDAVTLFEGLTSARYEVSPSITTEKL
jgi:acyl-CoA thioesterase FadM